MRVEENAFGFEHGALQGLGARHGSVADLATGIDHPLPRNVRLGRQRMEGVSHLARAPGEPRRRRDLTVGGDPSLGHTPNRCVDLAVGG